jgi:hypothetical protein
MIENNQQLLVTGSILHLARIDESVVPAVVGPARDVGTITVVNPGMASDAIELFDARGGRRSRISRRILNVNETAEVMCSNLSLDNLAFTFGADAVQTYTQSATPLTGVSHYVYPDSKLHLHDNSGNYLYPITSVQSIGTLVNGTDFVVTPEGLKMGYVTILPTSAVAAAGATLNVSFTPAAVSGARWFAPQKQPSAKCEAWIYWTSDDYQTVMLRDHVQVYVTPANAEFSETDYSKMRLNIAVISNLANTTRPAGRFVHPVGAIPNRTI